jgi:hypothetical protein
MMLARPLQRLCGLLLALGIVIAPATVKAQNSDSQAVTPEELQELERLLADLGFFPGPIDGVIDDKSRTAIRGYQDFAALPTDGEPSATLLAELRGLVQLMAELNAQSPEPDGSSRPDSSLSPGEPSVAELDPEVPEPEVAPAEPPKTPEVTTAGLSPAEAPAAEPPMAEPSPQGPTDSVDPDEPTTTATAPEPSGDGDTEAQAVPEPVPAVTEAAQPDLREPATEATHAVTEPPPAPRKPALAPAPPAEPSAPSAGKPSVSQAPADSGSSTTTPQEPSKPPAPAGTLLEQIVAAIDNPPARPPEAIAPAPEAPSEAPAPIAPAPSVGPEPASESDAYQAALAPFLPLLAAGKMSEADLAQTFNDRGKGLYAKGLYDQAIADYGLAIRVKPDFAEAYHNRGVAHEALGDFVQAKTDFEAAKRLGFSQAGAL